MSRPTGSLPPAFQALETRLSDLQGRYGRGEIDAAAYQVEVQGLTVQDEAGQTWWLGGDAGAWHYWDGSTWVRGAPSPTAQAVVAQPAKKKERSRRPLALGCGVGALIILIPAVIFLVGGWQAYQQEPKIVEGVEPRAMDLVRHALSGE